MPDATPPAFSGIPVTKPLIKAMHEASAWTLRMGFYDEKTFNNPVTFTLFPTNPRQGRSSPDRFEGVRGGGHINGRNHSHFGNPDKLRAEFRGDEYEHEPGALRLLAALVKPGDVLAFDAQVNDNGHLIEADLHQFQLVVRVWRMHDGSYKKLGSLVLAQQVSPKLRSLGSPIIWADRAVTA